jgi:hypothetical protein
MTRAGILPTGCWADKGLRAAGFFPGRAGVSPAVPGILPGTSARTVRTVPQNIPRTQRAPSRPDVLGEMPGETPKTAGETPALPGNQATEHCARRALGAGSFFLFPSALTGVRCRMIFTTLAMTPMIAAAGWAFLVWLGGGGFGLAFLVFIVLKVLGK